ncbi:MAG: histidinol dehydrogenase [Thermoanaerobaculales bacterium]|nr:histidinol dehydrogenase [Thermoanaerobaculales bacterium]
MILRRIAPGELAAIRREPVDAATLAAAAEIVDEVRAGGEAALRRHAERLGELVPGGALVHDAAALDAAAAALQPAERGLLERTAARIESFALAQRAALRELAVPVAGGEAGHQVAPVERAGCYAPGGRYPLPSSVLMTAVTARAAGVAEVWVASPRPSPITLAAAGIAGADGLLAAGGAQAIAALAYGVGGPPPCDVVVGPGNRWVTAAKKLVAGRVGIDMLAGPSELVVLADSGADPELVAADLLAQAEHDPDALPVLVTTAAGLAEAVESALARQLIDLPTRETAAAALGNGFAVVASDLDEAVAVCDRLAPEHLQVLTANADAVAARLRHWGGLFIGAASAEVLGDYGAGPNHTLPTGGVARFKGGLSVLDFLRVRTWLRLDGGADPELARDAAALARLEGLEAHARAAERRLTARREP